MLFLIHVNFAVLLDYWVYIINLQTQPFLNFFKMGSENLSMHVLYRDLRYNTGRFSHINLTILLPETVIYISVIQQKFWRLKVNYVEEDSKVSYNQSVLKFNFFLRAYKNVGPIPPLGPASSVRNGHCVADHSTLFSAEFKNGWTHVSTSRTPLRLV